MAADRRKRSSYTQDRGIPGAFEGETVTRRRFMTGTAHTVGGIATAAFALPALGFALGPVFDRGEAHWEDVGPTGDFPDDTYVTRVITETVGVGETGKTTVYLRRRDEQFDGPPTKEEPEEFIAISTRCMHLGCPVRYVEASQRFICPCHGGVYDFLGKVSGGPPVRPLDRFYTEVRDGRVQVGPRYSVNDQLDRFPPRDPGEPLNGIGKFLYPPRITPARP